LLKALGGIVTLRGMPKRGAMSIVNGGVPSVHEKLRLSHEEGVPTVKENAFANGERKKSGEINSKWERNCIEEISE
jgi:hypothetical protein